MNFFKQGSLVRGLTIASAGSVLFFVIRLVAYGNYEFWYLNWNLVLAALPLFFAWKLSKSLETTGWTSNRNLILSALWLGFLPNSFYIATDFIHLVEVNSGTLLFDVLLFLSFTMTGLFLGYVSLVLVHRQLRKRFANAYADTLIGFVLFLCSFAIYLGRYLRWNTWDVILNPAGLLFDVSDRIVHPRAYGQTFSTTLMFFIFLTIVYTVILQFVTLDDKTLIASTLPIEKQ